MRYFFLCLTLLFSLLGAAEPQYENQSIERLIINVKGSPSTQEFMERSVRARIKTRDGDFFSQADFDQDLKTLVQEFDRVDPILESIDGRMRITLNLWIKPTIRCISWEGNRHIPDSDLQSELGVTPCSIFDRYNFNQAFHKLKAYYVKKGYFEAQLSYNIAHDDADNEVEITVCIQEGRAGRIKDIIFCGFANKEEAELLDMMYTKKYNLFTSWFTEEGTYNEEAVQQDQFIILNYLQNEGYADADVNIEVCEAGQENRIVIRITADKGARYYFGSLSFDGNTLFSDEEICRRFKINNGMPYSPEKIRQTIESISNFYGRYGYIETYVNYEPKLIPDSCCYNVHFKIDEGDKYCVGLIKVFGNCSTQTNVILHETLLVPGEVFNAEKLRLTERRLHNIGYFKNVNVYAVRTDDESSCLGGNYRDVHVEVEEADTGSLGAFLGVSTTELYFGGINLTERNFNYKGLFNLGRQGMRGLRGGGEYLHMTAAIGAKSRKYILSWTKPYFMDTPWSVGFDIETSNNRYIADDYNIDSWGITPHASYNANAFLRINWHYRLRYSGTHIPDKSKASISLRNAARNNGITSAIGTSLVYDSTDSPMRPTCGIRSRLEGEFAGIGGDFRFAGLGYLNSYYQRVDDKTTLKLRGDFRYIFPLLGTRFKDMPLDERIFMGGENEIRGFKPYRIGPLFSAGDPRGGISMELVSVELQRRIFSKLDGFVFLDSGYLTNHIFAFGYPDTSAGFGIRLQVFENGPPLTLGYGIPFLFSHKRDKEDEQHFFMSMGGRF